MADLKKWAELAEEARANGEEAWQWYNQGGSSGELEDDTSYSLMEAWQSVEKAIGQVLQKSVIAQQFDYYKEVIEG